MSEWESPDIQDDQLKMGTNTQEGSPISAWHGYDSSENIERTKRKLK